jgi:hypothetical protein
MNDLKRFDRDIRMIACRFARDRATRNDLQQEMRLCLMALPEGKPRAFYRISLARCAHDYWARRVLDAPLDRQGRPILERRTVTAGGLAELDRLHQRRAA